MTIKEESIVNPEFSGQVELGTASTLMIEERTTTIKLRRYCDS